MQNSHTRAKPFSRADCSNKIREALCGIFSKFVLVTVVGPKKMSKRAQNHEFEKMTRETWINVKISVQSYIKLCTRSLRSQLKRWCTLKNWRTETEKCNDSYFRPRNIKSGDMEAKTANCWHLPHSAEFKSSKIVRRGSKDIRLQVGEQCCRRQARRRNDSPSLVASTERFRGTSRWPIDEIWLFVLDVDLDDRKASEVTNVLQQPWKSPRWRQSTKLFHHDSLCCFIQSIFSLI